MVTGRIGTPDFNAMMPPPATEPQEMAILTPCSLGKNDYGCPPLYFPSSLFQAGRGRVPVFSIHIDMSHALKRITENRYFPNLQLHDPADLKWNFSDQGPHVKQTLMIGYDNVRLVFLDFFLAGYFNTGPGKKYIHQGPEFTDIMNKIPLSIQRRNQNNDGTQDHCIQDQKDEIKRTHQGVQDPVKDDLQCL